MGDKRLDLNEPVRGAFLEPPESVIFPDPPSTPPNSEQRTAWDGVHAQGVTRKVRVVRPDDALEPAHAGALGEQGQALVV